MSTMIVEYYDTTRKQLFPNTYLNFHNSVVQLSPYITHNNIIKGQPINIE